MRHFLDLHLTPADELRAIIEHARAMKAARGDAPKGVPDAERPLAGRVVALVFEKPSTRTRVSFDVGIRQMGGETLVLSGAEMQLGHGETIADTARVLSRFVDAIMIRTFEESVLQEMAEFATVPVINGLTNASHPCQIMADVMTYEEHRGPIAGSEGGLVGRRQQRLRLVPARRRPVRLRPRPSPARPCSIPRPRPSPSPAPAASTVAIERDPLKAAAGADLVVTDTWISMHDSQSARERRHALLRPYQVNDRADGGGEARRALHALPPRPPRGGGDERGDGRAALGGLRRGREPAARAEGDPALVHRGVIAVPVESFAPPRLWQAAL